MSWKSLAPQACPDPLKELYLQVYPAGVVSPPFFAENDTTDRLVATAPAPDTTLGVVELPLFVPLAFSTTEVKLYSRTSQPILADREETQETVFEPPEAPESV